MDNNTQDKMLVSITENTFWGKIKGFLKKIFGKEDKIKQIGEKSDKEINLRNKEKNLFNNSIKVTNAEERDLLELQKKYELGEIKEEELTQEQVQALCLLYDKQIEKIEKSNKIRKMKILEWKKKQEKN